MKVNALSSRDSIPQKWGVPVIFLHFPEFKEPREQFRQKSRMIRDPAIRTSPKHANFHFIELDEIETDTGKVRLD